MMTKRLGKGIALWVMCGFALASTARADPILFDPNGSGTNPPASFVIGGFDFSPGNTLAQNGNAPTAGGVGIGVPFNVFFQASLGSLLDPGGSSFTPAGLNGTAGAAPYEITVVAGFGELKSVEIPGVVAVFGAAGAPNGNNFVRIYFDSNPATFANPLAGTGYDDGTLILAGTNITLTSGVFTAGAPIVPLDGTSNGNQYPGISSVTGSGGSTVTSDVTFLNAAFFGTPFTHLVIDSQNNTPFKTVDPSSSFLGTAPSIGTIDGFPVPPGGPDVQLETDASGTFSGAAPFPEPSTLVLSLIGFGGLSLFRTARNRRKLANS